MFKTAVHDLQFYSVPQTAVIKSTWTKVTVVFYKTSLLKAFRQQCPLKEYMSSRQFLVPSTTCSYHLYSLEGSQRTLGVKTPGLDQDRGRSSPDQGGRGRGGRYYNQFQTASLLTNNCITVWNDSSSHFNDTIILPKKNFETFK
jgi:hypothetical protein